MKFNFAYSALFAIFIATGAVSEPTKQAPENDRLPADSSGDYCIGGKYESDNDINDGNRISDEEIQQLPNPPTS